MKAQLFSSAVDGVTLDQAARLVVPHLCGESVVAYALLYSPTRAHLCLVSSAGSFIGSDGREIETADVFEARCFSDRGELRWLHEHDGRGRAVYLSENDQSEDGQQVFEQKLDPVGDEALDQTYVLFGKGTGEGEGLAPGWSRMAAARVGAIDVPIADVAKGDHACLKFREYIGPQPGDEDGNWVVLEERFVGLEIERGEIA